MKVTLIIAKGKLAGKAIPITEKQYVIGRHRECDMCVKSDKISVHHCAVLIQNEKAWVRDFDSTNGTYVNDVRITGDREVNDGEVLRVGTVLLQVRVEADTPKVKIEERSLSDTDAAAVMAGSSADIDKGLLCPGPGSVYELTDLQDLPIPEAKPSEKSRKKKT